jgi:sugar phosphate isomerase/epimerase
MSVFISTMALRFLELEEIILEASKREWNIEFSSGLPFKSNMEEVYKRAHIKRIPHNYFPAPEVPFVLNLSSLNEDIRQKSMAHCKKGLLLAKQSNSPFFSAHAGFCIDPKPEELGKQLGKSNQFIREENMLVFIRSINELLDFALDLEIDFLIENNVISAFNLIEGVNPLLCTNSKDIKEVFNKVNRPNFHLLLDTGHLKVSAITLGLEIDHELDEISQFIQAIHHSDNDGIADTNELLDDHYWFKNRVYEYSEMINVLEVKAKSFQDVDEQIKLLKKWM